MHYPEYPIMHFVLHWPPYESIDNQDHVKTPKFRLMAIIIKWLKRCTNNVTKHKVRCRKSVVECRKQLIMMIHYWEKKSAIKSNLTKSKKYCLLKSDSHLAKWFFSLLQKCFLVHHVSSFSSQDILIFVLTSCSCRKNDLIRKLRLISKFMTSQPG